MESLTQVVHTVGAWGYLGAFICGVLIFVGIGVWLEIGDSRQLKADPSYRVTSGALGPAALVLATVVTIALAVAWKCLRTWA